MSLRTRSTSRSSERRADRLSGRRPELRGDLGAGAEDVIVLCVARLGPEKRLGDLVRAVAQADDPRLLLVLAGDGPERQRVERLARDLGIRHLFLGDVEWERIVELYVASDVFALLSERETWAVVVNEAAACGLPLVLSDRVGRGSRPPERRRERRPRPGRRRRGGGNGIPRAGGRSRAPPQRRERARASSRETGATARASRDSWTRSAKPPGIGASLLRCLRRRVSSS